MHETRKSEFSVKIYRRQCYIFDKPSGMCLGYVPCLSTILSKFKWSPRFARYSDELGLRESLAFPHERAE